MIAFWLAESSLVMSGSASRGATFLRLHAG